MVFEVKQWNPEEQLLRDHEPPRDVSETSPQGALTTAVRFESAVDRPPVSDSRFACEWWPPD